MHNLCHWSYKLPERTGDRIRDTTVNTEEVEEPVSRKTGGINTNTQPTSVPQETANSMAFTRSQSAELKQQNQQQQRPEVETNLDPVDVIVDTTDMTTTEPDPRGQTF